MFPGTKTPLMLLVLTTTLFSVPLVSHPVLNLASAQGQQYSFVTKWGSEGVGFGKFIQPLDISIDADNNVYVTDTTSVSKSDTKVCS